VGTTITEEETKKKLLQDDPEEFLKLYGTSYENVTKRILDGKGATQPSEITRLQERIAQLEQEQAALNNALADGSLYASDPKSAADKASRVAQIDDELLAAMERLEVLSQRTRLA
jgi:hypothetical protein